MKQYPCILDRSDWTAFDADNKVQAVQEEGLDSYVAIHED